MALIAETQRWGFQRDEFDDCVVQGMVSMFKKSFQFKTYRTCYKLSRKLGSHETELDTIVKWGLTDRLRRMKTTVPAQLLDGVLNSNAVVAPEAIPQIDASENACLAERGSSTATGLDGKLERCGLELAPANDSHGNADSIHKFLSDIDLVCSGSYPALF